MEKRIYLSDSDKKIAGVCGGIGEYLGIDSTIVRLLTVVLTFFTGIAPGIIVYVVAWGIIPQKNKF